MRILVILLLLPAAVFSQGLKNRVYKPGEVFKYRLTTEASNNGRAAPKSVSISQHRVVNDSGYFSEEVTWISKKIYLSEKDSLDLSEKAKEVPPYRISLVPGEHLKIPPLKIPEMTGEITDLNTFYVAIAPAMHASRLNKNLTFFTDSSVRGKFADGKQILAGEDYIQVTQRLLKKDKDVTIIETSFLPPDTFGIVPYLDTIGKKTFNSYNNFQMIRAGKEDNKVSLLWGVEAFVVTSTVDNKTGQLLQAVMVNELQLRMRLNASKDLSTYDAEVPVTIRRELHLELMKP
jgi:hypothetical protein